MERKPVTSPEWGNLSPLAAWRGPYVPREPVYLFPIEGMKTLYANLMPSFWTPDGGWKTCPHCDRSFAVVREDGGKPIQIAVMSCSVRCARKRSRQEAD